MNDEVYGCLSQVIEIIKRGKNLSFEEQGKNIANIPDDFINIISNWLDEVEKDYAEGGAMFD